MSVLGTYDFMRGGTLPAGDTAAARQLADQLNRRYRALAERLAAREIMPWSQVKFGGEPPSPYDLMQHVRLDRDPIVALFEADLHSRARMWWECSAHPANTSVLPSLIWPNYKPTPPVFKKPEPKKYDHLPFEPKRPTQRDVMVGWI